MKNVFFLGLTLLVVSQMSFAQVFTSSFETWSNVNSPDAWLGSTTHTTSLTVNQSTDAQIGTYSCQLVTSGTAHRRFSTQPIAVTAGTVYSISFFLKGAGEVRTGLANAPFGGTDYQSYNSYIQASSTWTQHTQQITATLTGDAQFIFSVINSVAPTHILIDNVVITTSIASTVPIYDIQYSIAADGASPLSGQTVTTAGVVTGTYNSGTNYGYFIQDEAGAWNGIHVFQGLNANLPAIGSEVQVTGSVVEFNGLTQLTNVTTVVMNPSATQPDPVDITTLQLSAEEQWEGVLVRVVDATCNEQNSGFGMWRINDGSGDAKAHNLMMNFTPVLNNDYTIIGVVNFAFDEFRICPRSLADINGGGSGPSEVTIYEIQYTTATDGASPLAGQTVSTRGVVSAVWPTEGFFIQHGSGAWNGIFVFNSTINPAVGDSIALTGNVFEYFGLTQLTNISANTIITSGNTLPAPALISTSAANAEQFESVFVRVQNAICTNSNAGFGMFKLNNSSMELLVDDDIFAYTPVLGNGYNAQGVMWFSFNEFKMLPRVTTDIELMGYASLNENDIELVELFPNPAVNSITISNFVGEVSILDIQGKTILTAKIDSTNSSIALDALNPGIYFAALGSQTIRFVKN
jgi:predicted extracellular nuclease